MLTYLQLCPPKPTNMNKKHKGATTLSKRALRKSAGKPGVSVVTPPDLDDTEQTLDGDIGVTQVWIRLTVWT